jgi:ribosomal protein S5
VIEAAGITNIVSKMLGSSNKVNNVKAAIVALSSLKAPRFNDAKNNSKPSKESDKTSNKI